MAQFTPSTPIPIVEPVSGVEGFIAEVVKEGPGEAIASRASRDRDLPTRHSPKFWRVARGLYPKLLQRIDRYQTAEPTEYGHPRKGSRRLLEALGGDAGADVAAHPVDQKVVGVAPLSIDRELPGGNAPTGAAGPGEDHSRSQFEQGLKTAPIEGKIGDELSIDKRLHRCTFTFDQSRAGCHDHRLPDIPDREGHLFRDHASDADRHLLTYPSLEPISTHLQAIASWSDLCQDEEPLHARGGLPNQASVSIDCSDRRIGNCGSGRIDDSARDLSRDSGFGGATREEKPQDHSRSQEHPGPSPTLLHSFPA